jgi:hypothetical protein
MGSHATCDHGTAYCKLQRPESPVDLKLDRKEEQMDHCAMLNGIDWRRPNSRGELWLLLSRTVLRDLQLQLAALDLCFLLAPSRHPHPVGVYEAHKEECIQKQGHVSRHHLTPNGPARHVH